MPLLLRQGRQNPVHEGTTWLGLADSMYFDATARRNATVSYTNPDPAFTQGARNVP